jgi:microcystin-dependent protein
MATTAAAQMPVGPVVGEVRAFAVNTSDPAAISALQRAGWIEAAGQLLSVADFSAAFKMIGRGWTPHKAPSDRFAIPDLRNLSRTQGEIDERTAELLGGIVTGGRNRKLPRLLYCVYVAVDTSTLDLKSGRLKSSDRQ